ncbi:MAG: hypothetical protein D6690_14875 [Nitrospirae bacterium]|nr:MAG: hypothetical protein D6690_14875 [Nitrospirota bacterium]
MTLAHNANMSALREENSIAKPFSIPQAFFAACESAPDRVAIQIKEGAEYRRLTYRDLAQQVRAFAAALMTSGVERGDRIAIFMENRPEWAVAYLGIVTAGCTAVPLDVQVSPAELASLLRRSRARFVIVSDHSRARVSTVVEESTQSLSIWSVDEAVARRPLGSGASIGAEADRAAFPPVDAEDVASLLYTSGTTGLPKGVLLTHRNLMSNATGLLSYGLAGPEDNFLLVLPLHHPYPFMLGLLVPLLLGARITILTSLKGPDLIQCMQETRITIFIGVPQLYAMMRRAIFDRMHGQPFVLRTVARGLLAVSGLWLALTGWKLGAVFFRTVHRRLGGALKLLASGGAKLDPQVFWDFERIGFTIREGYGLTETSPVVAFNPIDRPKIGSVGLPLPGVEVRIVAPDAQGIGEVAVRGPNVMKGYDGDPEATRQAIRDGWFHTGDLGYLDADGYLFLVGRSKELIVTPGGKKIQPEELEAIYEQSPAIAEICLLGREDTGELQAVVVPDLDYLAAKKVPDIRQHLKDELTRIGLTLPPHKRVTKLSIVKEPLPRTRLGKLRRHEVAALLVREPKAAEPTAALTAEDAALFATEEAKSVLEAIQRVLPESKSVSLSDHLDLDLGLDSLRRMEVVAILEQRYGPLPDSFAMETVTVRDVIEKLQAYAQGTQKADEVGGVSWDTIIEAPPPPELEALLFRAPSGVERGVVGAMRVILRTVLRIGFRFQAQGIERLPRRGPFVLVANHTSYFDPFVILTTVPAHIFTDLYILGWEAYFRGRFLRWVARIGHVIPLGIETSFLTALRMAVAVLKLGKSLLIFPEGERSVDGRLLPFKKGVGILASHLHVPVVPMWIEGTYRVLPVGARWPRRHPIALRIGPPVTITCEQVEQWKAEGLDPSEMATQRIRAAVESLAGETVCSSA